MLEFSRGEIGWDVFTLEYKVDAPIDTVLDQPAMTQYLKMFNHLWRIKHVEYALDSGWRRIMTDSRAFRKAPGKSLWLG
jgi:gamma-tubulin complex component 3